ncbi:hypothetical protein NPIL_38111 [Nephila pilipes]|uniref:Uncharacterized protein n=1 Tax=Nephila pilipes TaxID=299642 RepID=A0A8X6QH34_NEPPI|nr:hypothetical protein NPIL_38111 [Nephila pilipes]
MSPPLDVAGGQLVESQPETNHFLTTQQRLPSPLPLAARNTAPPPPFARTSKRRCSQRPLYHAACYRTYAFNHASHLLRAAGRFAQSKAAMLLPHTHCQNRLCR